MYEICLINFFLSCIFSNEKSGECLYKKRLLELAGEKTKMTINKREETIKKRNIK